VLSIGTIYQPSANGIYYLAISVSYSDARNASGPIFETNNLQAPDGNYIYTPTGPGAGSPLSYWVDSASGTGQPYTITLAGAGFADPVPIPGAVWLLGGGLAGLWARGKRPRRLSG